MGAAVGEGFVDFEIVWGKFWVSNGRDMRGGQGQLVTNRLQPGGKGQEGFFKLIYWTFHNQNESWR